MDTTLGIRRSDGDRPLPSRGGSAAAQCTEGCVRRAERGDVGDSGQRSMRPRRAADAFKNAAGRGVRGLDAQSVRLGGPEVRRMRSTRSWGCVKERTGPGSLLTTDLTEAAATGRRGRGRCEGRRGYEGRVCRPVAMPRRWSASGSERRGRRARTSPTSSRRGSTRSCWARAPASDQIEALNRSTLGLTPGQQGDFRSSCSARQEAKRRVATSYLANQLSGAIPPRSDDGRFKAAVDQGQLQVSRSGSTSTGWPEPTCTIAACRARATSRRRADVAWCVTRLRARLQRPAARSRPVSPIW
jgi:hypothetical protein